MAQGILLLGAGSHGRLLCEQLEADPDLRVVGFTDSEPDLQGRRVRGHEVLGGDDDIPTLWNEDAFDVALVGIGDSALATRSDLRSRLQQRGIELLTSVHDTAEVAGSARLGEGTVVMPQSYVGTATTIGDNVVVYSSVTIEHECTIADDVYISPGAVLCGEVSVGRETLIGANATVLPGCTVGDEAVVGAGAVVTRDIGPGQQVTGIPAEPSE
jgi:UDP-perosamine 4-acetyltransferase